MMPPNYSDHVMVFRLIWTLPLKCIQTLSICAE